jgi:hypothetical protein
MSYKYNPLTGKLDYFKCYDDDISDLQSGFEVLFENDKTPSGNTLSENPPITNNYFMPTGLQSDSRYIMVFGGNSFTFFDCRNPYAIEQVENIVFDNAPGLFGQPQASVSIGDFVYACTTNGKIHTIDWSNKEAPTVVASFTASSGQHFDIASNGSDTLFIANVTNNLFIAVDASTPTDLSLINTQSLSGFGAGVAYYNDYAYCGNFGASTVHTYEFDGTDWLEIDVTPSATNSSRLGIVSNIDGQVALVSNKYNSSSFTLHSLANPENIGAANTIATSENINVYSRAFSVDGLLYTGTTLGKTLVYNVRNLDNVTLVGLYEPLYPDGTKRFSDTLGSCSFNNFGAVTKENNFIISVGQNNVGATSSSNRDIVSLKLPLIELKDKVRLLSTSRTIGGVGVNYHIITSGITVTLPSTPNEGDLYKVANFSDNSATISGNGNNIMEETNQLILKDESFFLLFNSNEWKVI